MTCPPESMPDSVTTWTHTESGWNMATGEDDDVISETRVNGAAVAGQSRRTVAYVAANGNTMREATYVLLADGETWALLSGVTNSYDGQNRLIGTQKQLISQLSATLESKMLSLSERGLTSTQWSVYDTGTKHMRYSSVPTSNITAETVMVDGFTRSQKDTAGIMTTATRAYTAIGNKG